MGLLDFTLLTAPKIIFGHNATKSVGQTALEFGAKKALIISDQGLVRIGLTETISDYLGKAGIESLIFDEVQPEPSIDNVEKSAQIINDRGVDVVIGLGGGSSMDVAKCAAVLSVLGGSISDYFGVNKISRAGKKKILIPTTSGTGSEVSRAAVLNDYRSGFRDSILDPHLFADVALVDPLLTSTMPKTVTADTGLDALVHAVEAYVSPKANPFSDLIALDSIKRSSTNLLRVMEQEDDLEARSQMSLASMQAAIAFTYSGLGAVHGLSYPLGTKFHLTHGRGNGVMLPYVAGFNYDANPQKFSQITEIIADALGERVKNDNAEGLLKLLTQYLERIGVSCRLRNYGIGEEDLNALSKAALEEGKKLIAGNPKPVSVEDSQAIFRRAW